MMGDSSREQRLASARGAIQQHALARQSEIEGVQAPVIAQTADHQEQNYLHAFGCEIPKDSKISGCLIGSSMTSLISCSSPGDQATTCIDD